MLGRKVQAGDWVAIAYSKGSSSAQLRVGQVKGFGVRNYIGPTPTVEVEWFTASNGRSLPTSKITTFDENTKAFVKITDPTKDEHDES